VLSIVIPVYNSDVRKLVQDLLFQGQRISVPFEIVLVDDASHEKFSLINSQLKELHPVRMIQLPSNIGRSAIRNLLAREAAYSWLLFLDCDSGIPDSSFLTKYLANTGIEQVICGGRFYGKASANKPEWKLHRKYGIKREQQPAGFRNRNPYRSFMTNNFLIHKNIFQEIGGFDEQVREYGHEDTLFGYQLERKGICLTHIDNPVEHLELETNRDFIQKSLQAAENLAMIDIRLKDPGFHQSVNLLRFHDKMNANRMSRLVWFLLRPFRALMPKILLYIPSLLLLDALKYLHFLDIVKRHPGRT
jgi:glycosyltransferase involved in cell wall biosynthesis